MVWAHGIAMERRHGKFIMPCNSLWNLSLAWYGFWYGHGQPGGISFSDWLFIGRASCPSQNVCAVTETSSYITAVRVCLGQNVMSVIIPCCVTPRPNTSKGEPGTTTHLVNNTVYQVYTAWFLMALKNAFIVQFDN